MPRRELIYVITLFPVSLQSNPYLTNPHHSESTFMFPFPVIKQIILPIANFVYSIANGFVI